MTDKVRIVVFKDGDLWVAQCLEYDIGAQAADLDTVRSRIDMAIQIERETSLELMGEEFVGIPTAPAHFEEMWDKRSRDFQAKSSIKNDGREVTADLALCA